MIKWNNKNNPEHYVCCVLCSLSRVRLFATLCTVAHQAPLSIGFPKQEYWSGLPLPSPGDLCDPGIKPGSPAWAGGFTPAPPGRPFKELVYTKMSY